MTNSYDEGLAAFLAEAKVAYEQMFKPERQAELRTFSQRELCVYEEGRRLSRALLAEHLAHQLHESAPRKQTAECPHCQRECRVVSQDLEVRPVSTLVGDVAFPRAKYRCKHCRKSFFPSGH
ncbi:MAG TPA: hypothetical protein VGP72_07325 [Planctomycetota bacterium]|jgi:transposase-like protein